MIVHFVSTSHTAGQDSRIGQHNIQVGKTELEAEGHKQA